MSVPTLKLLVALEHLRQAGELAGDPPGTINLFLLLDELDLYDKYKAMLNE